MKQTVMTFPWMHSMEMAAESLKKTLEEHPELMVQSMVTSDAVTDKYGTVRGTLVVVFNVDDEHAAVLGNIHDMNISSPSVKDDWWPNPTTIAEPLGGTKNQ